MRPGLLEIILIIVVIIIAAVIMRIARPGRGNSRQNQEPAGDAASRISGSKTASPRRFIRRTGIAFILAGIVLFLAGISMFRWAFQSYAWALVITAAGFVIVLLSRKK